MQLQRERRWMILLLLREMTRMSAQCAGCCRWWEGVCRYCLRRREPAVSRLGRLRCLLELLGLLNFLGRNSREHESSWQGERSILHLQLRLHLKGRMMDGQMKYRRHHRPRRRLLLMMLLPRHRQLHH